MKRGIASTGSAPLRRYAASHINGTVGGDWLKHYLLALAAEADGSREGTKGIGMQREAPLGRVCLVCLTLSQPRWGRRLRWEEAHSVEGKNLWALLISESMYKMSLFGGKGGGAEHPATGRITDEPKAEDGTSLKKSVKLGMIRNKCCFIVKVKLHRIDLRRAWWSLYFHLTGKKLIIHTPPAQYINMMLQIGWLWYNHQPSATLSQI